MKSWFFSFSTALHFSDNPRVLQMKLSNPFIAFRNKQVVLEVQTTVNPVYTVHEIRGRFVLMCFVSESLMMWRWAKSGNPLTHFPHLTFLLFLHENIFSLRLRTDVAKHLQTQKNVLHQGFSLSRTEAVEKTHLFKNRIHRWTGLYHHLVACGGIKQFLWSAR